MSKYLKEFVFIALFVAVIILIIGILFYEFIPNKAIPDAEKYKQTAGTAKLISQIEEEQQQEGEEKEDENVLKSYEVTEEDLKVSQNQKYLKGKNHPFYDYTKVQAETTNTTNTENTNTTTTRISDLPTNTTSTKTTSSSENETTNSTSTYTNTKVDTSTLRETTDTKKSTK